MLLCRGHERGPRVSADLALPSGGVRGRATAALPQNLPTGGGGAAPGVTVRAVRDDVHGPPRGPEATYWPRIQKSIVPSASQAIRHSCNFRSVARKPRSSALTS
jgi:hypothetical protein